MRTMNVNCPVCQQTHPNTHLQFLDWQTVRYTCPIIKQVVNLENFIPGATTMVLTPGNTEDSINDTNVEFGLIDTVPFTEVTASNQTVYQGGRVQNVLDDVHEVLYIGGGGVLSAPVSNVTGADFTAAFGFQLTNSAVQIYSSALGSGTTAGNMPIQMSQKLHVGTLQAFIEIDIEPSSINLRYWSDATTLVAETTYAINMQGGIGYTAKLDMVGTTLTLTIWQSGALQPPIQLSLTGITLAGVPTKQDFSYGILPANESLVTPNYSGTYPLTSFLPFMIQVFTPTIVMHNETVSNADVIPATPLA